MFSPYGFPQNGARLLLTVIAASTGNVADLASCSTTMDGVTLVEGNLVLLKNQTATEDNGVYKVGKVEGAHAPMTRHDLSDLAIANGGGVHLFVATGTANAGLEYALTTSGSITVGTTSLTFTQRPTQSAVASLETRLSADESVGELSSASSYESLTTRLSTEESTRTSADSSLTAKDSVNLSTALSTIASGDASLTAKDSVNLSTALSTTASSAASITAVASVVLSTEVADVASIDAAISSLIASIDA